MEKMYLLIFLLVSVNYIVQCSEVSDAPQKKSSKRSTIDISFRYGDGNSEGDYKVLPSGGHEFLFHKENAPHKGEYEEGHGKIRLRDPDNERSSAKWNNGGAKSLEKDRTNNQWSSSSEEESKLEGNLENSGQSVSTEKTTSEAKEINLSTEELVRELQRRWKTENSATPITWNTNGAALKVEKPSSEESTAGSWAVVRDEANSKDRELLWNIQRPSLEKKSTDVVPDGVVREWNNNWANENSANKIRWNSGHVPQNAGLHILRKDPSGSWISSSQTDVSNSAKPENSGLIWNIQKPNTDTTSVDLATDITNSGQKAVAVENVWRNIPIQLNEANLAASGLSKCQTNCENPTGTEKPVEEPLYQLVSGETPEISYSPQSLQSAQIAALHPHLVNSPNVYQVENQKPTAAPSLDQNYIPVIRLEDRPLPQQAAENVQNIKIEQQTEPQPKIYWQSNNNFGKVHSHPRLSNGRENVPKSGRRANYKPALIHTSEANTLSDGWLLNSQQQFEQQANIPDALKFNKNIYNGQKVSEPQKPQAPTAQIKYYSEISKDFLDSLTTLSKSSLDEILSKQIETVGSGHISNINKGNLAQAVNEYTYEISDPGASYSKLPANSEQYVGYSVTENPEVSQWGDSYSSKLIPRENYEGLANVHYINKNYQ